MTQNTNVTENWNTEKLVSINSEKLKIFFVMASYTVVGLYLSSIYRYHINTDVPTYIAIAEKYAYGHFFDAVNGFWSPLISWLMVPFILSNVDPLLGFKLIGIVAGLPAFIVIKNLLMDFSVSEKKITVLLVALFPAFYAFTLITVNPDFLLAVILLFYLRRILDEDYGHRMLDGVSCGFLGTMAYLAKSYAFPFFLVHFSLINLMKHYAAKETSLKSQIRRAFILGIVTFLFFSSIWISLISFKEGRVIFSKVGGYNFLLVKNGWELPINYSGFIPPPDPIALSVWDDPSLIPCESRELDINLFFKTVVNNFFDAIEIHQEGTIFFAATILVVFVSLIGSTGKELFRNRSFQVLVTMFVYLIGYLPLLVTRRYFYLNILLLFILGNHFLWQYNFHGKGRRTFAILCFCLSFMVMPLRDLYANIASGKNIYEFSMKIKKLGVHGRIASNGHLDESIFTSYHLMSRAMVFFQFSDVGAKLICHPWGQVNLPVKQCPGPG